MLHILQSSDNQFMAYLFYYYLFCYIVITSNAISSTAPGSLAILCCFGDSEVALRVQLRPRRWRFTLVGLPTLAINIIITFDIKFSLMVI